MLIVPVGAIVVVVAFLRRGPSSVKNLDLLKEKMGIEEIRKKQEELKKLVQEMKEKTEEKE